MKNISFLSKHFQFLEVKFSIYLNRHVFVMIYEFSNCVYIYIYIYIYMPSISVSHCLTQCAYTVQELMIQKHAIILNCSMLIIQDMNASTCEKWQQSEKS